MDELNRRVHAAELHLYHGQLPAALATARAVLESARLAPDSAAQAAAADAWVLLARIAAVSGDNDSDASRAGIDFLRNAVVAAEIGLGREIFREEAGLFWQLPATRAYMRARLRLAVQLWDDGARTEAMWHASEVNHLNAFDDQGVRYLLAGWLVETAADQACRSWLEHSVDDRYGVRAYLRALLAFREEPGGGAAARLLAAAIRAEPEALLPLADGTRVSLDSADPEVNFGVWWILWTCAGAFQCTPGAAEWLRSWSARPSPVPPTATEVPHESV